MFPAPHKGTQGCQKCLLRCYRPATLRLYGIFSDIGLNLIGLRPSEEIEAILAIY
jgi:hypothetical protein